MQNIKKVESGKENLFLREKAEKAMDEVVEVLCADNQGQKVLLRNDS